MAPAGRGRGVTLLELLVVLALVGVLAALAYPSYRGYLVRAHRMEAIEALLTVAAAQERFHLQHGRYADGFEPEVVPGLALAPVTSGGRYALRLEGAPPGGFAALASPREGFGQERDARCSQLALDGTGRRWAVDGAGRDSTTDCWR
jgi:type IV pilus assembly protein PilE